MVLDVMDGWTLEKTPSGKNVLAPGPDSESTPYLPPKQAHSYKNDHLSGNSGERSYFTNALLPYTSKYPIIHAIMTEKDSRRIFYFMLYVLKKNLSCNTFFLVPGRWNVLFAYLID